MVRRTGMGLILLAALVGSSAQGAISHSIDSPAGTVATGDYLEAHQYALEGAQVIGVGGRLSDRQNVTAWQITHGSWNGQTLDGLSLVVVQTTPDDGSNPATTNCYISYVATPAQRTALVAAYLASHGKSTSDSTSWRLEPAVIRYEFAGQHVVVHLGAIG